MVINHLLNGMILQAGLRRLFVCLFVCLFFFGITGPTASRTRRPTGGRIHSSQAVQFHLPWNQSGQMEMFGDLKCLVT